VELFDTLNLNNGCTCTSNVCAASVEENSKVNDMGLASSIVDNCCAFCKYGSKDSVSSSAYGNLVKINSGVANGTVLGFNLKSSVLVRAVSTERLKSFHVKVEGTCTDAASTRMGNAGATEATELCTENVGGTAESGSHLVGGGAGNYALAIYLYREFVETVDSGTHGGKDFEKNLDVIDGRDIFDDARLFVEDASTNNGKGSVFHAAYRDVAVKSVSAVNDDLFHNALRCPLVRCLMMCRKLLDHAV
jgi:hypothetical protein